MVTLFSWDGGALPTTVGDVSLDAANGVPTAPGITIEASDLAAFARWDIASTGVLALRFYFSTPTAWPSSSYTLAMFRHTNASYTVGLSISGSGSPGQFRLIRTGGATILASPSNTLQVGTQYRAELQYDVSGNRARAAVFEMSNNLPLWESGWQVDATYWINQIMRVEVGRPNNSPNSFPFLIDSLMATDQVTDYIGRHANDGGSGPPPDPNFPMEWSDGALPTVSGNVTVDSTWGHPTQPSLKFTQLSGESAYVNMQHNVPIMEVAARCYMRMPSSWASGAWGLITLRPTAASVGVALTLSGGGQPGQIRLSRVGGATVVQSTSNTLSLNALYRFELRYNANFQQARAAVFGQGSDIAIWDSGWQTHTDFANPMEFTQFGRVTANPTVPAFNLDNLFVNNTSLEWVGRVPGDEPVGATVKVATTQGGGLVNATAVKVATTQGGGLVTATKTFVSG